MTITLAWLRESMMEFDQVRPSAVSANQKSGQALQKPGQSTQDSEEPLQELQKIHQQPLESESEIAFPNCICFLPLLMDMYIFLIKPPQKPVQAVQKDGEAALEYGEPTQETEYAINNYLI